MLSTMHQITAIECPSCRYRFLKIIKEGQKYTTCSGCGGKINLVRKIHFRTLYRSQNQYELQQAYDQLSKTYNQGNK